MSDPSGFQGAPGAHDGRRFRESVAIPSITEPEAVEHALGMVVNGTGARYDAVVSAGTPYPVSGRSSVFYESDCTHALNKGEPKGDVTAGLCLMTAGKIVEPLARLDHERVLLVGGTGRNTAVVDYLRCHLQHHRVRPAPGRRPLHPGTGRGLHHHQGRARARR